MDPTTTEIASCGSGEAFGPDWYDRLMRSPRGRAFHLSWMAHAEEADEGVFDQLLLRVDAPDLNKLVRLHAEDEQRHARLLRECAARAGVTPEPVPAELGYIERLRRLSGGSDLGQLFAGGDASIMGIFAMLQVVEERGVQQFPLVEQALRRVDPESADVLAAIIRDEQRHVKYAQAISRRYAPDEGALAQLLGMCREVEAVAFAENRAAYRAFVLARGLLGTF